MKRQRAFCFSTSALADWNTCRSAFRDHVTRGSSKEEDRFILQTSAYINIHNASRSVLVNTQLSDLQCEVQEVIRGRYRPAACCGADASSSHACKSNWHAAQCGVHDHVSTDGNTGVSVRRAARKPAADREEEREVEGRERRRWGVGGLCNRLWLEGIHSALYHNT